MNFMNSTNQFAGVMARVESLPPSLRFGDLRYPYGHLRRGMMSEAGRQVNGLFESLLSQSFQE